MDLSATKITEFTDRVVTVGSEKILTVAAIYGANASGKSNIYNAFEYMSEYVVNSFKYGDEDEKFEEFRPTPFCSILHPQMRNLALRYILRCPEINLRDAITMVLCQ